MKYQESSWERLAMWFAALFEEPTQPKLEKARRPVADFSDLRDWEWSAARCAWKQTRRGKWTD